MTFPTITLLGAGNMGSSIIGGLIASGHPAKNIWASDLSEEKLQVLADQYDIHITTNNLTVIEKSDVIILAIKPQVFGEVLKPLASLVQQKKPLIISIAAGIRESKIDHWLGGQLSIVRVMPNTPALLGAGAAGLHANEHVTDKQKSIAESIMQSVGVAVWVKNEDEIDTVTALSGSGPAYFFLIMEAMIDAACELGLSEETAKLLTVQTAQGAARMAIDSKYSLETLRKNVTSKGGTTEKGVSVLEKANIREIIKNTLAAAKARSVELSGE